MRTSYVDQFTGIFTAMLILFVVCLSGCGPTISAFNNSSSTSSASADLSSYSLIFGNVTSSTSSSAQTATLSNTGKTALNIYAITLSGIDANSFNESNNCPTSLTAGNSCIITATLTPVMAGSFTAAITISDNALPSTQAITLNGTVPPVAVSVSPATTTLNGGQTAQLTAIVTNTVNKAVTWSTIPVGIGSISTSGLYTAPATITTAQTVTVKATSQADTTASSSMTIMLAPSVVVSVSPATTTLNGGQTAQLTAIVRNASNSSVTWSAQLGTITPEGLYTAPQNTGSTLTDTITATSIQDPTKYATANITVSSGLVGWWPLDEGTGTVAHDISGQGNNGTWGGTPSSSNGTYYTTGEIGSAAGYFNGTDNSLTIGTQPVYEFTGPFTVSLWIKPASLEVAGIFARENFKNNGNNGYLLALYPSDPKFSLEANDGKEIASADGSGVGVGVWTLLTTVYDGTNLSVYVNGTLSKQVASGFTPPANNGSLVFGMPEQGGLYAFNGSLEDIRVYSRALSASEITFLYNADISTPNSPTDLQTYPGSTQMGLTWNTPSKGATVTDYTVNYRKSGTSTWTVFTHNPSVVNEQVVTGLMNGTSYDFEVIPVNAFGKGTASNIVTARPTATPTAITVSVTPNKTSTTSGTNIIFTATVTNALNPSVTWSAQLGTITPEGLYTAAPNMGSSTLTDTITATSIQDPTKYATANITVSSGLVGWWPLDEGTGPVAHDISGQGNNGTWGGTPSSSNGTYYTTGEIGSAVGYFNGTDNSLTIGTQPVYEFTGPFTVSLWIKPASLEVAGIFARENFKNNGNNGYLLALYPSDPKFSLEANDGKEIASADGSGVGVGVWTLLTTVYDGTNLSVYVNGTLSKQVASGFTPPANNGSLVFGMPEQGGLYAFNGSLEDIRVYSRALSASEIYSHYNTDVGTPNSATDLQTYPGSTQMGLSWNTPSKGATVTDYTVNYRKSGTSTWTVFTHNPSVVNEQVVTGLMNGTSYDFEVIPVSVIGNGAISNIVTATPTANILTSSDSDVVASDDDEFIGPFSSWLNVKTKFGAVGDGVTDDTIAFQYALNALESASSHASVLYIPAGTYKITSGLDYVSTNCSTYCIGKSIIGESPTNTILKWQGDATESAMFTLDGINRMQFDRLTLDGSGAQITLINETMHQGCCYDGSNEYSDDIFENAAIGIQAGDNTVGCCSAETKVDRDIFSNFTKAGISLEDWNALDWYVRYSTFEHNHYGVTNAYGAGGAMHLDHNLFEYNYIDSGWGNGSNQSYTYNTSYYSGIFFEGSPYGNTSILIGNTVLMPQTAAISMPSIGPLTLINNTIEGSITAAQSSNSDRVTFADGSTSTLNSYVTSMGNTYVSATPFSVQNVTYGTNVISGGLTSINDTVASISNIHPALPVMPGPLPNNHRKIYEVPQGASGATIQTTINQAIAENNGNRPVVHIPWGQYSVTSTITIAGNSDVQIVGDSMQTILNWNGSTSSSVFALLPPSHVEIRNLMINATSSSAGILVEGYDLPGDRIYTNFAAESSPGSSHNLLVNGFDNTLVQMDDFAHGGLTNSSSTSVLVVGGPLTRAGNTTPGYTGLFMGASCCSTDSYRVEDGGTIVLAGFWYEQGGPSWLDLDGASGNFIGYEDNIAVPSGGSLPSFTANNFTGNLTITNSGITNGHVNLAGSTSANVLLLADSFSPQAVNALVQPPVIANTNTNPNTQAATIYSTWLSGSIAFTVPDVVSAGSARNTLIQNSLIQLASYKDPAIKDLPSANEDVRLVDVIVNNGVNSFDFESIASSFSARNHVSLVGNSANSGVGTPSSWPTSPWGKLINKEGLAH